ncbi:ATP-binding cassette domain-containing protein [Pseudomonas sp. TNT2022 ID642]|uniref:ATP-binding cassette domain-containing protein n=1 Tax=Pseudomonas sp. TNT2022 ID642 TaxID=2942632 RepID=UPI00235DF607|nr:ABC transporter ATP-binding protein [Pseudomonas sp. TNT2022 ID642]MDD1004798.1 ABC transporter ATP-binding protein/permease [Pseudomonas sp. TNT2022 ID642]
MNWLYQYIKIFKIISKNYRWFTASFIGISAIFLLCSALNSLLPVILRNAANSIHESNSMQTQFLFFAASYSAIWTLSQVLSNIRGILSAWILAKCDTTIYETIINRIFKYPYKKQKNLDPGFVVADINRSASSFSMITIGVFWTITPITVEIIIAISVLYAIMGHAYAILFLLSSIVLICISIYVARSSSSIHRELFEADAKLSSYTVERLGRTYDIKLNSTQLKECHAGKSFFDNYVKTIRKANLHMGTRIAAQGLAIGTVLAFFVILSGVNYHSIFTSGDFIMITGYITMFTMQLHLLAGTLINLQGNLVSLDDGVKYIEEKINNSYYPNTSQTEQGFVLRELSLTKDNNVIFSRINYQFKRGVNIIAGSSGAGKTTLINTLLGLEENYTGAVHYRGHLINETMSEFILSEVSVAPQQPILIAGTFEDNLLYGSKNVSPQKLRWVIELLGLSKDNSEIEGLLATVIGAANSELSGGEKQRIAIGRAILRDKHTLILDEPTSSLDDTTAYKIIEWLAANIPCLIIVTHDAGLKKKYGVAIELTENHPQST